MGGITGPGLLNLSVNRGGDAPHQHQLMDGAPIPQTLKEISDGTDDPDCGCRCAVLPCGTGVIARRHWSAPLPSAAQATDVVTVGFRPAFEGRGSGHQHISTGGDHRACR
jgi:hypothetical protein